MERREFAKKAAMGVVGGGLLAACGEGPGHVRRSTGSSTTERVTWRLASSFPRGLDTIYGGSELLSERVAALTGGQFQIRPYPAGELVPPLQVMDAVQQGTIQVGHTTSYYYVGKNPALAFDAAVPFGLSARAQNAWLYHGGGLELMRELYSDFNIINFPGGNTGTQMGGWFRRPIETVNDLRGLKMRIPGLGGEVMARLGVSVQVLAGGDIYPALERGVIDATEFVGPYDDEKLGLHEVADYYYGPGWWEPGPTVSFLVNRAMWDALPQVYKDAFETATREVNVNMLAQYDAQNPAALARLVERGVQLRAFPDDMMQAALRESTAMFDEQAAADPGFRRILTEWRRFRTDSARWFSIADLQYETFAYPKFTT